MTAGGRWGSARKEAKTWPSGILLGDVRRGKGGIEAVEPTLRGIGVKVGWADGGGGGSRGLLLLVVRCHLCFDYRLRVKSVTSVAEACPTQPDKETAS